MSMSISSTRRIIASSDGRRRNRCHSSSSLLSSSTTLIMASAQLVTIIVILLLVSVTNINNNIVAVEAKMTTSVPATASRRTTATATAAVSSLPFTSSTTSLTSFVTKTLRGGGGIGRGRGVTKKVTSSRATTATKTAAAAAKTTAADEQNDQNDGASILTSIFNLSNNVAGAGILTLASGKATSGTGYLPSILICLLLAGLSSHTFNLVGKSCQITGYNEFKDLWSYAFGNDNDDTGKDSTTTSSSNTSWIVDTMVFIQCFFVSIIYTGLLGDVFSALLKGTLGINQWYTSRTSLIVILSTCLLFPLNLIQDLSSLGFTSILGLLSVLYTVGFMVIRSLDGSYSIGSPNGTPVIDGGKAIGKFILDGSLSTQASIPNFTKSTVWNIDINALVLISNLGLAFIAHYNAPSYWKSLGSNDNTKSTNTNKKIPSKSISKSQKFQVISQYSYLILACIYVTTMICGYKTFGDISKGNILLNYSSNDKLALFGRLATGLSIIFGFPLISYGCREGLKNMCSSLHIMNGNGPKSGNGKSGKSGNEGIDITNPKNHTILVLCLLCVTTFCSIIAKDIGLVAGLTGAIMGSSLVYICPPLLYTKIIQRKFGGKQSIEYQQAKKNLLFIPFGIFTAIMGVIMTIKNAFFVE